MNLYSYLYTLEELQYTNKVNFCSGNSDKIRIDKEVTFLNIYQKLLKKEKSNSNDPVFLANHQLKTLVAMMGTRVYHLTFKIKSPLQVPLQSLIFGFIGIKDWRHSILAKGILKPLLSQRQ